jgi:hypothetical protein
MPKYRIKSNIPVAKRAVKRTFSIPEIVDKALKLKALMESRKATDVLVEALYIHLKEYIEQIYLEEDLTNEKTDTSEKVTKDDSLNESNNKLNEQ